VLLKKVAEVTVVLVCPIAVNDTCQCQCLYLMKQSKFEAVTNFAFVTAIKHALFQMRCFVEQHSISFPFDGFGKLIDSSDCTMLVSEHLDPTLYCMENPHGTSLADLGILVSLSWAKCQCLSLFGHMLIVLAINNNCLRHRPKEVLTGPPPIEIIDTREE
jgi:hypothetical protein